MNQPKALPEDIGNFFKGESVFFHEPPDRSGVEPVPAPAPPEQPHPVQPKNRQETPSSQPNRPAVTSDGMFDGLMSLLQDVNLKAWQEIIENTETQNSALRLTSEERYAVEDVVNELRRKEKIKTSMNELARLGLLLLIHDFKQNRQQSFVYQVKKS